jgi:protein associated with RNAse G/E
MKPINTPKTNQITVIKLNIYGQESWRYLGKVLKRQAKQIIIEAFFDRQDMLFNGMPMQRGDHFVETYFSDHWYNILEIHDKDDDRLRGWYCNITYPAEISDDSIRYIDLALDLLVFPDGRQLVLDEDEFDRLELPPGDRIKARQALDELKKYYNQPLRGKV